MKAFVIKPTEQTIEGIEISNHEDIVKLIGFETVIGDDVGASGDKQLDKLIPVSGVGIIVGSNDDGSPADTHLDIEDIRSRIKFLD